MQDRVRPILAHRLGDLGAEDHRLVERNAADVLHRPGAEFRDEELVIFLERIGVLVGLAVEVEPLLGDGEDLVRIQVLRQRQAAEDAEVDVTVPVPDTVKRSGHDRRQVGGHLRAGAKGPTLDVLLAGDLLGLTRIVGDDHPVAGGEHGEGEAGLEVRLIETGEHPVGVEGLELAVEVDLVVHRVGEFA